MGKTHRAPSQRQLRVGEELRHAIANILERGDIRDPDVAGRPVTVTEVAVSPDLRKATVFVVPLGGGDSSGVLAGLKRVRPYLRHEIARLVQLRLVPDLAFAADVSFDQASRIEALLNSPEVRRDVANRSDDDDIDDGSSAAGPEGRDDGA
jgi:ribosome-binding factor A